MVSARSENHNGIEHLTCASDYEVSSAPPYAPVARVLPPLPATVRLTLNMVWAGADGVQYSATARGNDVPEVLGIIKNIQTLREASNARREKSQVSVPEPEPDAEGRTCKIHNIPMVKAISKKNGRPYHSHQLIDGSRCFGRKSA
jgi:hypothetical protein